jgi:hypothetical protein
MNKIQIYSLTSTNLTGLGGPMGTESTTINYIKYFTSGEKAANYAIKEYVKESKRSFGKENLKKLLKREYVDLGYVGYKISKIKLEE